MKRPLSAAVCAAVCAAMLPVPAAWATAELSVGMPIDIGQHRCTLGFFATNDQEDRLAVTAGHCSDYIVGQGVYAKNGAKIGVVVAWKEDVENTAGRLRGSRGYTVFLVHDKFSIDPFFTGVSRSVAEDDYVSKYGQRTGETHGYLTKVTTVPDRPDLDLLKSNMVQLAGDSGGPWYKSGPTIIGIASSGNMEREGGDADSAAQPIGAVLDLVRENSTQWGEGFAVWITD